VRTQLLLAGQVDGPVETLMDSRQVALFGAVTGAVLAVFLLIGRLFGRD